MKYNLLIVVLVLITIGSANCELDADDCPNAESLFPCHCDREGLSCFNELTEESLSQVFAAQSKYKAYRSVWITQNPIKQLNSNAFNGYRVFHFLIEENDQLETIKEGAFSGSYPIIRDMSLFANNISYFPFEELSLMTSLEKLTLSFNRLTTIPANSFSLATKLAQVDLSVNQINSLEPGAFFGMANIQVIYLANNELEKIPALAFSSIQTKFQVDLSDNLISYIDPTAFLQSDPSNINLSGNQLTFLDPNVFEVPVKHYGTSLVVADNPFSCTGCSNYKWLLSVSTNRIQSFQCANGRRLSELNLLNVGCLFV